MIKKQIYNKINITINCKKIIDDWKTILKFHIKTYCTKNSKNTDVSFLPPMARRKLTAIDKTALCIMNECFSTLDEKQRNIKIIFASQYGELDNLNKLIKQYKEENEVSPTTFSGSVHNSAVGQFSLLNKITQSYNSVSAEDVTFSAGLIEAILSAKKDCVLYCFCDSLTPEKAHGFGCIISPDGNINAELIGNKLYKIDEDSKCIF